MPVLSIQETIQTHRQVRHIYRIHISHASYTSNRLNRPWKMYPLGIMFGLGFDTSSEVALLGISSIQGAKGTSIWLILIFPILFTGKLSINPYPSLSTPIPCLPASFQHKHLNHLPSRNVPPRHPRRRPNDDALHLHRLSKRPARHPVLLNRAHAHHHRRRHCHRGPAAAFPDPQCRGADGEVLERG